MWARLLLHPFMLPEDTVKVRPVGSRRARAGRLGSLLWLISWCVVGTALAAGIESHGAGAPDEPYLVRSSADRGAGFPGRSGFLVLDSGKQAFLARAALIESAERTIDAQYYIWNSDDTGRYLASRLLAAADRGVRVRILLDDINVASRDAQLAWLDAHPQIEIRLYNPVPGRKGTARLFSFARSFTKLNRRMHNKSFTVDGAATIVGGRNIGDEYFDASGELNFRDRDVLAAGPVVPQVGRAFETFWNSEWAVPIQQISQQSMIDSQLTSARIRLDEATQRLADLGYGPAHGSDEARRYWESTLADLVWASAQLVSDTPPQALEDSRQTQAVAIALGHLMQQAKDEVLIESAYFILADRALGLFAQSHQAGVRVRALTNSLASNDLTTNHSGYARRRKQMLRAGIELHELRPDAPSCRHLIAVARHCSATTRFGLHSKSAVFDRRYVYIGSFNVNLRSAFLNTETALLIDSPELARQVAAAIEENLSLQNSWRVELHGGSTRWITLQGATEQKSGHEPGVSVGRRMASTFYGLFPLEKYL